MDFVCDDYVDVPIARRIAGWRISSWRGINWNRAEVPVTIRIAEGIGVLMFISSVLLHLPEAPRIPLWKIKDWTPLWEHEKHYRRSGCCDKTRETGTRYTRALI
jgi:hypothetical protein